MREITYAELAAELEVSPRHARRILRNYAPLIQPVIYSHKNRRFRWTDVVRLKGYLRNAAIVRGRAWAQKRRGK